MSEIERDPVMDEQARRRHPVMQLIDSGVEKREALRCQVERLQEEIAHAKSELQWFIADQGAYPALTPSLNFAAEDRIEQLMRWVGLDSHGRRIE